jgi:DDE superfamily endonuclease
LLSVLIINDDQRLICYYLSGWPGSAHDNRVWNQTPVFTNPEKYFSPKQYILGDSAYDNSNVMVSSYMCPKDMELPHDQEVFNTALARPRMAAEHTIGMLKARFPFLRSIRMPITDNKKTLKIILMYIDVCIILHNLLIKQQDPIPKEWFDSNDAIDPSDDYIELNKAVPLNSKKDTQRQQLTLYINEQITL